MPDPKPLRPLPTLRRFFGGAIGGGAITALPLLYGASPSLTPTQWGLAAGLVLLCGLLASVWGRHFMNSLIRTFDSTGL